MPPLKLKSFLTTGKNKRITVHKHACSILGLDTEGKADEVRDRLLSYAKGDEEKDKRIRAMITEIVEKIEKGEDFNPSQDMFSQTSHRASACPDDENDDDGEESDEEDIGDDDDEVEGCDTNLTASSTPRRPPTSNQVASAILNNKLTDKMKTWMGSTVVRVEPDSLSKDANSDDAISVIETSFAALSMSDSADTPEGEKKDKDTTFAKEAVQTESSEAKTTNDPCCNCPFNALEAKKVIDTKNAQIDKLEQCINMKEGQLTKLEEINRELLAKMDSAATFFTLQSEEVSRQATTQNEQFIAEIKEMLSAEKISQIAEMAEKVDLIQKNVSAETETKEWQKQCQEIMLDMAKSIDGLQNHICKSSPATAPAAEQEVKTTANSDAQKEIIIIGDSNTKHLKPAMLHHEKKVTIERRATLEKAIQHKPIRQNPDNVTDIVLMTGLNDSRDVKTSNDTILKRQRQVCREYADRFKQAKIHIAAVAPVNPKQRQLNQRLEEYAEDAGFSYIDHGLFDRDDVDLQHRTVRENMLDGVHYTEFAIRTVAKHIKRKIYPKSTNASSQITPPTQNSNRKANDRANQIISTPVSSTDSTSKSSPAVGLMNAMETFFRNADKALASIGHSEFGQA